MLNLETLEITEIEHTRNWNGFILTATNNSGKTVTVASLDYPSDRNPDLNNKVLNYKNREIQEANINRFCDYLKRNNINNLDKWKQTPNSVQLAFNFCFGEAYPTFA